MAENVLDSVRATIQDLVAPEVRVLRTEVESVGRRVYDLRTEMNQRFGALQAEMNQRLELMEKTASLRHEAILAAIGASQAAGEAAMMREIAGLRERVAVLESRR